jgi:predicted DNA-binding transcriptional regulator AlpA
MPKTPPPELLTDAEAAAFLGVSASFLRKSRMTGARKDKTPPPPFVRIGRLVRYRPEDLNKWLEARRVEG